MKILLLADEEVSAYWDFFRKEDFDGIDLIISCGDLKASYLSFLATMTGIPILYVCGNHDDKYKDNPPEGCICIEDMIYEYEGVRFLGLGGSNRYKPGINQYSEKEMTKRATKLLRKAKKKGVDILVTHAPAKDFHDAEDACHTGFEVFHTLLDELQPKYFVHGHVHMNYGRQFPREDLLGNTMVINAFRKYIIEV